MKHVYLYYFQACEYASQPAIKSVHLFGNPYNKLSLLEDKSTGNQGSQEFMIGKTASKFVGPYHTLFHFKYNLYKRCQAKVSFQRSFGPPCIKIDLRDKPPGSSGSFLLMTPFGACKASDFWKHYGKRRNWSQCFQINSIIVLLFIDKLNINAKMFSKSSASDFYN